MMKSAFSYLIVADLARAGFTFGLTFLASFILPIEEFGLVATYQAVAFILIYLTGLGVHGTAASLLSSQTTDKAHLHDSGMKTILVAGSISLLVITAVMPTVNAYFAWFDGPLAWLAAITQAIGLFQNVFFQMQERGRAYLVTVAVPPFIMCVLFIILTRAGLGWRAVPVSQALGACGFVLAVSRKLRTELGPPKDSTSPRLREFQKLSLKMLPHHFSIWLAGSADRLIIAGYLGLEAIGRYGFAVQFLAAATIVSQALNNAFLPRILNSLEMRESRADAEAVGSSHRIIFGSLVVALGIVIGLGLAERVLPEGSLRALVSSTYFHIPWLASASVFQTCYFVFSNVLFKEKKFGVLSALTATSAALKLCLLFLILPRLGERGVSITVFLTFFFMAAINFVFSAKIRPLPWLTRASSSRPVGSSNRAG